ncbi:MAG: glutathione S-transferase [Nannocystaceae bacterium]
MITVHHLEKSRSHRVLWMLEELGVPYEIVRYARDPKTLLGPASLREIHPLGKSPTVTDDGRVLAESGAILEHLVERYGDGRFVPPAGSDDRVRHRYFMHYAEGSLMPYLLMKLVCARVKSAPLPFFVKPIARRIADGVGATLVDPNLQRHVAFLDGELAKAPYFGGAELSAADVQMSYPVTALIDRAAGMGPLERLREHAARMRGRPAFQRALQRGGEML